MNSDPATDQAALDALRTGVPGALDGIVARWQRPLLAFAWRYVHNAADAEDLVAETFVRLHQQSARLTPDTRLAAWLFTILAHQCHNLHRWRRRHPTENLGDDGGPAEPTLAADTLAPNEAAERAEAINLVRAAVDALPHDLKTAILLHHYEHLPLREIGAIVGCSERGVETRLYRARQRLRSVLADRLHAPTAS